MIQRGWRDDTESPERPKRLQASSLPPWPPSHRQQRKRPEDAPTSLHLAEQLGRAAFARGQLLERLAPAGSVGCRRAQQFAQLRGSARIESAPRATRQTRDLAERLFGSLVMSLLEHEHG